MGLLGNIVKSVKKVGISAAANFTTAIQKPVAYVKATAKDLTTSNKSNVQKLVTTQTSKPLSSQIGSIIKTTATAAAVVVGAGALAKVPTATKIASGTAKAASSAAKAIIPAAKANPKTTAAIVIAAPSAATLLLGSEKARETTAGALKSVATGSVGTDLAKTIEGKQSILETISEHPIATGAAALGTAVILGKGLTTAGAIAAGGLLANDNTTNVETKLPVASTTTPEQVTNEIPATTASPQTAQTQKIVTTGTTSTKKRRRKAITKPNNISQRVNVLVNTTGIRNTNYIKRQLLNRTWA